MAAGSTRSWGRCVSSSRFAPAAPAAASGLVGRQVSAQRAVVVAALERRFCEEEVGVAGELDQLVARPGVARVGDEAIALDAEAVRVDVVVDDWNRGDLEPGGGEGTARLVLGDVERALEHVLAAQPVEDRPQLVAAARRQPGAGRVARARRLPQTQGTRSPQWSRWRCVITIASMRATPGQVALAELRQHAGAAVQQQPARAFDQIARMAPPGFGQAGDAADDRDPISIYLPTAWRGRSEW